MFEALVLLTEFVDSDVNWLLNVGTELEVHSGTTIIREGSHPTAVYFVLEGLLGLSIASAGDKQLAVLGSGELVGELSFLENRPATATVAAVESTLLLVVQRSDLEQKLLSDTAFAARFYRSLALISSNRLRQRVNTMAAQLGAIEATSELRAQVELHVGEFKRKLEKVDGEAIKSRGQIPDARVDEIKQGFRGMVEGVSREIGDSSALDMHVKEELGARLKTELLPYLLLTRTAERFYSKPRGYAGDFFTIECIYRNKSAGSGRLGPLLDECFLASPPAKAVRNRRSLLAREIRRTVDETGGDVRIASLACGPAREVFDVLETLGNSHWPDITLLDIDPEALAFVENLALEHRASHSINAVSANLIYLALGRQKLQVPPQHLVYSIGLIDYFNDKLVLRLIDYIHSLLEPGGRVLLGNFHPNNSDKAFMDYILEWKLIHRTEDDMDRLFAASKFGRKCTQISFEQEGINLFAECIKD